MFKYVFIFCGLFFWQTSFSQSFKPAVNSEKMLSDLKKTSQSTNSIQADFREEKKVAILKESKMSSGVFYYKKTDKMRWEQKLPFSYVILINGDRIRIQDAGKEKKLGSAGRMAAQINELMIGLVNGDFQQNKAFKITCMESADLDQIILTPVNKRLKNVYSKIELVFPKSTHRLQELSFFEKGGDTSVMKFKNEKINQPIAESLFSNL